MVELAPSSDCKKAVNLNHNRKNKTQVSFHQIQNLQSETYCKFNGNNFEHSSDSQIFSGYNRGPIRQESSIVSFFLTKQNSNLLNVSIFSYFLMWNTWRWLFSFVGTLDAIINVTLFFSLRDSTWVSFLPVPYPNFWHEHWKMEAYLDFGLLSFESKLKIKANDVDFNWPGKHWLS